MKAWLFFHIPLEQDHPEKPEILRFLNTAKQMNIEALVLNPLDFELVVDHANNWSAIYNGKELEKPDIIIPRTGSETTYFMLAVMRHFENQGVIIINSPASIEAVADKLHTQQILAAHKLPVPKTILGKFPVDVDLVESELGFPVIIKTLKGTRGSGVVMCENREQFLDLIQFLSESNPEADFIFQEYIRDSHGRDVRIVVVNGNVVAAMERRSTDGNFKSNISLGGEGLPFLPNQQIKTLALDVAKSLNLEIAGIDILFDKDGYKICEANSSPGFQGLEVACKINIPEVIFESIMNKYGLTPQPEPKGNIRRFVRRISFIKNNFTKVRLFGKG
jgi:gamma-F420-2:alpha-L-glutamate ligase